MIENSFIVDEIRIRIENELISSFSKQVSCFTDIELLIMYQEYQTNKNKEISEKSRMEAIINEV